MPLFSPLSATNGFLACLFSLAHLLAKIVVFHGAELTVYLSDFFDYAFLSQLNVCFTIINLINPSPYYGDRRPILLDVLGPFGANVCGYI